MLSFTDQLQRTIHLPGVPRRIVSLVPSQTELLYDLGLGETVAGITKFCIHPDAWFRSKQRVGGTKNVHTDIIHQLQPDLIIANKEENVQEQVEALSLQYPVWVSDVNTLEDALQMIRAVGDITGTSDAAMSIAAGIERGFAQLVATAFGDASHVTDTYHVADANPFPVLTPPVALRAAYLIWKDPYMTIGHDTFIHHMLHRIGLHNVFGGQSRYPAITIEDLRQADCQFLLLSSEPYPFRDKHIEALQQHLPNTRIQLVDGEMFSWYGSRLQHAPAYFQTLLHAWKLPPHA